MRLRLKPGVIFSPSIHILRALPWVLDAYHFATKIKTVWITSANDSRHMDGSLHYEDLAIDLRVWGVDKEQRTEIVEYLRYILSDDYDILDEDDHLHLEYDPKDPT